MDRYENANMAARYEREIPEGYEARIDGNKVIIELKLSEDERIRKELWEYFHNLQLSSDCDFSPSLTIDGILAYLERQKEQKPVPVKLNDDTEVGLDRALQIVKDAKGNLCGYQSDDGIYECDHAIQTLERILKNGIEQQPAENGTRTKIISRATNEKQVVLLSESNGNAEIDWDTRSLEDTKKLLEHGIAFINKRLGVKPAEWSKEDEKMLNAFLHKVEVCDILTNKENVWIVKKLQSLRPQPKQEWSEEDEECLGKLHRLLVICQGKKKLIPLDEYDKLDSWLKSFRSKQHHWKPSEKQMKWLKDVIEVVPMTCRQQIPLESLYSDLQKLL